MTRVPFTGRLGTFTWRMLATVLIGQSLVIFLGALLARSTALARGDGDAGTLLWAGCALGVLAIVAAVVTALDGEVHVTSEPGRTTFEVRLRRHP